MEAENFGHTAASDGLVVVEAAHRLRRVDQKRETVACGDTFECFPVTRPAHKSTPSIADVFGVILRSISLGSTFACATGLLGFVYESASISTNTGERPTQLRACALATKVKEGSRTSPANPVALARISRASVALHVATQCFTPRRV